MEEEDLVEMAMEELGLTRWEAEAAIDVLGADVLDYKD